MTREQFISGQSFSARALRYKGEATYYYSALNNYIGKQTRSSVDERVVVDDYCCNVLKVGKVWFEGFTYVMKNKVKVRYRFEDLVIYEEGV